MRSHLGPGAGRGGAGGCGQSARLGAQLHSPVHNLDMHAYVLLSAQHDLHAYSGHAHQPCIFWPCLFWPCISDMPGQPTMGRNGTRRALARLFDQPDRGERATRARGKEKGTRATGPRARVPGQGEDEGKGQERTEEGGRGRGRWRTTRGEAKTKPSGRSSTPSLFQSHTHSPPRCPSDTHTLSLVCLSSSLFPSFLHRSCPSWPILSVLSRPSSPVRPLLSVLSCLSRPVRPVLSFPFPSPPSLSRSLLRISLDPSAGSASPTRPFCNPVAHSRWRRLRRRL